MRILQRREGSVLWLLADNVFAQQNLIQTAAEEGVATERLIFAPRPAAGLPGPLPAGRPLPRHLPYNAGTTASDCLWMGTPSRPARAAPTSRAWRAACSPPWACPT